LPAGSENSLVRVSGITFNGSSGNPVIQLFGKNYNGNGVAINGFRIDHCNFVNGKRQIFPHGWCYGVIDHCSFTNGDIAIGISGDDDKAWERPVLPGSTNAVVIEDCKFVESLPNLGTQIYHQEGCRTTLRYCTFEHGQSAGDVGSMFECHGNQTLGNTNPSTDFRGQVLFEIYNNICRAYKGYRFSYFRGGSIFAFSNSFICDISSPTLFTLTEEESWQTAFFNPLKTVWPAEDQITNSYFWANNFNGTIVNGIGLGNSKDTIFIQQNRDYWTHAPQSGQPHFPYTPLVYPHPLVSGTAPPPVDLSTPRILVSPGSIDYGAVAVGSTNDLTITVQNVGGGTLAGVASVTAPFSIINGSAYSLGSGGSKPVTIRYVPTTAGFSTKTVTFSNVEIANASATVIGSAVGVQASLSFDSTAGAVGAPFTINPDNTISQSVETTDPTLGGRAEYVFSIPTTTNYVVSMMVYAPTESANSIFVSIDSEPTLPDSIWDIPTNTALKSGVVASRATGNNKEWMLTKGTHRLIICGREAGVKLGAIWVNPAVPAEIIPDSIKLGP